MNITVTNAVREALRASPAPVRTLAVCADVDPSLLTKIKLGNRDASLDVAQRVAEVLHAWGASCSSAAKEIAVATERAAR